MFLFELIFVPQLSVKAAKIATPFWNDIVQGDWWPICVRDELQVIKLRA